MIHFVAFRLGILVILAHDVGLQITIFFFLFFWAGMILAMQRAR